MKQYNIIWADDEIDILLNENGKKFLSRKGFNVVGEAHNAEELEELLMKFQHKNSVDKPDAIIVDANFNKRGGTPKSEREFAGLDHCTRLLHCYKEQYPFFLYTQRDDEMLFEKFSQGELDYFVHNKYKFKKGQKEKLLDRIKEVVDERATPEFVLRNKYPREFEVAKNIPGAESTILKSLLIEMNASNADSVDYYNALRKVIEGMFEKCEEYKIIPPITELNGCCTFLENKHTNYYIVEGEKIMHEALVYALRYALNVTQDGSHNGEKKGLKLKTDEYARQVQSNHVFSSILHITMDLLLWFGDVKNSNIERNALKWEKYPILAEVTIESVQDGKAYGGGYGITMNTRLSPLRVGDVVQIKKVDEYGHVGWKDYSVKS